MLKKILSWHRFPFWVFHLPTVPYVAWLSLRAGTPLFTTAANPVNAAHRFRRIPKSVLLGQLPAPLLPATWIAPRGSSASEAVAWMETARVEFPVITKPHRGERGRGVERAEDRHELAAVLAQARGETMVQEWVRKPLELGVLYHRFPGAERGRITSLARKHLPHVLGDGHSTLGELIRRHSPVRLHARRLRINRRRLDSVPAAGEPVEIEFVGQPFLGCRIECWNDRVSERLERTFDRLCESLDGFHYGRFDLKADSLEALEEGDGFKVLELNLNASMPIHLWDARYGAVDAYRILFRDWRLLYDLSMANHRAGVPLMKPSQGMAYLRSRRRELPADPG